MHTSYQLHIVLTNNARIQIGALGAFEFPAGKYVYTGSAKKNLPARIQRHLRRDKRLRWHIDYLLAHPAVSITTVVTSDKAECAWNQELRGQFPAPGFGASDCRAGCGSHLHYLGPA